MKDLVILAALGVGGFLLWRNWDKIAGGPKAESYPEYPPAPPTVPGDSCSNTVSATGMTVANVSKNPKAAAIGYGAALNAPALCEVGKELYKGAKSIANSRAGKEIAKNVATGGIYQVKYAVPVAKKIGTATKSAVKKLKFW